MERVKSVTRVFFVAAVLVGLVVGGIYVVYLAIGGIGSWFAGLDVVVQAAFIAVVGAVVTAITALFVKKMENKYAIAAQFRKDKAELFLEFMKAFDDIFDPDKSKKIKRGSNLLNVLKDFRRKMIVWCDVATMRKFDELRSHAVSIGDAQTPHTIAATLKLYGELLLSLRRDLGLSCRGLDKERFGLDLVLRHPDLFLNALEEDPDISMNDLVKKEKELKT